MGCCLYDFARTGTVIKLDNDCNIIDYYGRESKKNKCQGIKDVKNKNKRIHNKNNIEARSMGEVPGFGGISLSSAKTCSGNKFPEQSSANHARVAEDKA